MVEQGDRGQIPETDYWYTLQWYRILIDDQANSQDKVGVEDRYGCLAAGAVDQQPVVRSKRARKSNSKYNPSIYDFDSVEIRGIPLEGKKGLRGIY